MKRSLWIFLTGVIAFAQPAPQAPTATAVPAVHLPTGYKLDAPAANWEIAGLKEQLAGAIKRLDDLKLVVDWYQERFVALEARLHRNAEFDPTSLGRYAPIDTDIGQLFMSLDTVEPYLDGFKLELRVANPSSMTLAGFKARINWGPRLKPGEFGAWIKAMRSKELDSLDQLPPGKWISIHVILQDTKADAFGYFDVENVTTKTIGGGKFFN